MTHSTPPRTLAPDPRLSPWEVLAMLALVTAPLWLAVGHEWYDARYNPEVIRAKAEARQMAAEIRELKRINELERSRVAALRGQK